MSVIVQKYGGSSVADIEKLKKISQIIAALKKQGNDVAVVVSAMGKTTNELIEKASQISSNPSKREMDMLLSTGERITMALLCIALNELGIEAVSLTGSQSGVITNDRHNDARVIEVRPIRVQDELAKGKVVVIGGFQGVSYKREITTLGRGGSDTSAIALAAALNAERCEIYSDIDGVYSTDPKIVEDALHLPELSYQQIQEMSEAGAKVLNTQAIQFAKEAGITIYARSTFAPGKETIIRDINTKESKDVVAVVHESEIISVGLTEKLKKTRPLINFFDTEGVSVKEFHYRDQTEEGIKNISFIISRKNIYNWKDFEEKLLKSFIGQISLDESLAAVSIIGEGFSRDNSSLIKTLDVLEKNNIEYYGITTTSFRISLLVKKELMETTVSLLHQNLVGKN